MMYNFETDPVIGFYGQNFNFNCFEIELYQAV